MSVFLSTHYQKLDAKNRLSVPADFRKLLDQESVVIYPSYKHNHVLECVSLARIAALSDSIDTLDPLDNSQDDITASIFADATVLKIDGQGRITLPNELKAHCDLDKQAAFIGRGNTFQIWHPDLFKGYQSLAKARITEIMKKEIK
jgi:MraZ protein